MIKDTLILKIKTFATQSHKDGPLAVCLLTGLLLMTCSGGSVLPDQSAQAASQSQESLPALRSSV